MDILTDKEIKDLFLEKKTLPKDYPQRLKTKPKTGAKHEERELTIPGDSGNTFAITLRKNRLDFKDFSIILRYRNPDSGIWHNLVRYNGKHAHTNSIEGDSFNDFHRHLATQRYQEAGLRIESYAEVMKTYTTFEEATKAFIKDFNRYVEVPEATKTLTEFGGG